MEVIFEIAGKRIDVNKVSDKLQKAVFVEVEKSLLRTIGNAKCPIHNKGPIVVVTGPSLEKLSYEVKGCCDKLIEVVKKELATKK